MTNKILLDSRRIIFTKRVVNQRKEDPLRARSHAAASDL